LIASTNADKSHCWKAYALGDVGQCARAVTDYPQNLHQKHYGCGQY